MDALTAKSSIIFYFLYSLPQGVLDIEELSSSIKFNLPRAVLERLTGM